MPALPEELGFVCQEGQYSEEDRYGGRPTKYCRRNYQEESRIQNTGLRR
jgi:hypothetical protein